MSNNKNLFFILVVMHLPETSSLKPLSKYMIRGYYFYATATKRDCIRHEENENVSLIWSGLEKVNKPIGTIIYSEYTNNNK